MPESDRTGLATRVALVTMLAAGVAVLIAGLAVGRADQGGHTVERQERVGAKRRARVVAAAAQSRTGRAEVPAKITALLRTQGVRIVVVQPNGQVTGPQGGAAVDRRGDQCRDRRRFKVAASVDGDAAVERRALLRRGSAGHDRPAAGGGVVLVQKVATARSAEGSILLRLLVALVAGLVIAALTGVLLARRLARPLQHAAGAAHRLSTGARDVRLVPEGPAEVAEVADALNALSGALATSEGRQREFLLVDLARAAYATDRGQGLRRSIGGRRGAGRRRRSDRPGAARRVEPARAVGVRPARSGPARRAGFPSRHRPGRPGRPCCGRRRWSGPTGATRRACSSVSNCPTTPVLLDSDPTRLRQIVDGLAENALRVTPAGRPIVFAVLTGAETAYLQVRDGGPGLTDDDCRVAFDRSALYDRYRGVRRVGTGVGLALGGRSGDPSRRPRDGRPIARRRRLLHDHVALAAFALTLDHRGVGTCHIAGRYPGSVPKARSARKSCGQTAVPA